MSDPRPLTPEDRRRESFTDGMGFTLADGQVWTLAPPVLGFGFRLNADGKPTVQMSYVDGYDNLLDDYLNAEEVVDQICALAAAAHALLAVNYDVSFDEAGSRLLRRIPADAPGHEANVRHWMDIAAWVVGDRPKATPDGSEPPS